MKKIIIALLFLLVALPAVYAVPAFPGKYKYRQPDGTVLILQNHGDEYYHWTTDESGRTVVKGADGFYRIVPVSDDEHASRARVSRFSQQLRASWSSYDNPRVTNFGDRKVLCILANFSDMTFVLENPKAHFTEMLNGDNYTYNGAIGSVRQYYIDNSGGQYRPEFDVYGPVTLSKPSSYYEEEVYTAIKEAYELMADEIDINQYDTDDNGAVDMVLFYFPGYNEAEGGASETIWPHQGTGNFGKLGEKTFNRYFCTSELRGNEGAEAAAIGTTCHEFAHSLGLPDFYDVDKAENGVNQYTTYTFDLMTQGNYNDEGRRPPYLSALERNMLGWMPAAPSINSSGNHTLRGVQNNEALRIDSQVDGEYFLMECRTNSGWDTGLKAFGLLLYHVDQSARLVGGEHTAAYLWENTNWINSYGGHPCYYIVPSTDPIQYYQDFVYPGRDVTTFSPADWSGNSTGVTVSGISYDSGSQQVTFRAEVDGSRLIYGNVTDISGAPMEGVTVALSRSVAPFASAPSLLTTDRVCMTDADGYYSFAMEDDDSEYQVLSARKDGYVPMAFNVTATERLTRQDVALSVVGQAPPATLKRYDESLTMYVGSYYKNSDEYAVGMRYTASELSQMGAVGASICQIHFMSAAANNETVYLVVDIGGEPVLRKDVTSQYESNKHISIDVSGENIVIPEGKDVYIGYGLDNIQTSSPFVMYGPLQEQNEGNYYLQDFLSQNTWKTMKYGGSYYNYIVSATLSLAAPVDFSTYGVSYIRLADDIPEVVPASGKTVRGITWYLDGNVLSGAPTAVGELTAGAHTYMARLAYYDGTFERVYFDITID